MKSSLLFFLLCLGWTTACAQPVQNAEQARPDLYRCEGCEAIYEQDFEGLNWRTVIPPEGEPGERLILRGVVYQTDGKTPAPGVIIYAYHTDAAGVYPTRGDEQGWGRRHGYLRGWVKTDAQGRYEFQTIRPASYPSRNAAAHVHMTIKEPERREYWIDEVVFEDDPLVHASYRRQAQDRGGSGIIRLTRDANGVWQGTRDILLERHPK